MENSNKIENEQKHKKSNPGAEQEFDNIKVKKYSNCVWLC